MSSATTISIMIVSSLFGDSGIHAETECVQRNEDYNFAEKLLDDISHTQTI
jgi:hypothetical protein